ncbi:SRPBCC family protein [Acidaminobacter sp. JC074]|uniref:hypothetical protein n=1 Tax=Acidaminobacter sp. JC074 TaxID=2530199 RepID=UPI001F0DCCAA|nr:hypothetical protein [Acidaminobacter sp. JC074]MCH4889582.1 SRPBCC family protein [Acidaminobacter sp. JC074]
MKYTCEVLINKPRSEVIDLFDSVDNLYKWQDGLKSFDILEGTKGQDGLKSRMVYANNGKEMVMTETIEKFNFPDQMIAIYEANNVWNRCDNKFVDQGDKTLWIMETEFVCSGFMRLITFFGKKAFINKTSEDMNAFKRFAERQR